MRKNKALLSGSHCPANMKQNGIIVNPDNPKEKIKVIGFTELKDYRYHPTKGLRREAGFNPPPFIKS